MAFSWRGGTIHYQVHGEGTPLLLLNGIMMSTPSWTPFLQAFQGAGQQVIVLDLMDQGQSAAFEQGYHMADQADMVWGLMDHLGHERIHVLGTSYGGALALEMAVRYPQRVSKLLLAATRCWTDPLFEGMLESWLHAAATPEAFYTATIPLFYGATFQAQRVDWMKERRRLLENTLFQNQDFMGRMKRLIQSIMAFDLREQLHQITCPTLVLAPEEDLVMMPWEQQRIVQGIPDARLLSIPRTGHVLFVERPELFTDLVTGFFQHRDPITMP